MKVLVVNNMAPFVWGGAEELAHHLVSNLKLAGCDADLFRIPFSWNPAERLLDEVLLHKGLRLDGVDRVIALKFPAYLIPAENKVLWLLHQFRQAYDLRDAGQSHIPDNPEGDRILDAIRAADNECFAQCRRIFVNSNVTKDRLQRYNGWPSEVLMPPLNDPELFGDSGANGYIFAGGRVNDAKRQFLLVEAMRHVKSNVNLVIGGPPDSEQDREKLTNAIAATGLNERIILDLGFLAREKYAQYMNHCVACAYLPFDEDSVGYVTMEACQASKPVITTTDSGGLLQLVADSVTGAVAEPEPVALADAIDRVCMDQTRARTLGRAAFDKWHSMGINWQNTVHRLIS